MRLCIYSHVFTTKLFGNNNHNNIIVISSERRQCACSFRVSENISNINDRKLPGRLFSSSSRQQQHIVYTAHRFPARVPQFGTQQQHIIIIVLHTTCIVCAPDVAAAEAEAHVLLRRRTPMSGIPQKHISKSAVDSRPFSVGGGGHLILYYVKISCKTLYGETTAFTYRNTILHIM